MEVLLHRIPEKYLERLNEPVIEAASPDEVAMIEERMRDYEIDPSSFVPLK